ncbi:MAG: hypothetical protein JXQ30_08720 [Spirochaetes bacterium]|nr:hypothetical protein [Spirochaetota bacterium]
MSEIRELRIVPFELDHLNQVVFRAVEFGRYEFIENYKETFLKGPAYSAFDGESLVFCGGVVIYWKGVGEGWLICNHTIRKYIREVCFYVGEYLKKIISEDDLHRVQATVPAQWGQGVRFLERMGFQREGLLRKYSKDAEDYYIYSRVG